MYDQIRGLKTEIEENLRGIDDDIPLRTDGDVTARISAWNGGCHGRTQPWPAADPGRWRNVRRDYDPADVAKLTGSIQIRHTLAERGARKLWRLLRRSSWPARPGPAHGPRPR